MFPKSPPRSPDSLRPRWLFALWLLLAGVMGSLALLLIRGQGRDLQARWESRLNVHVEDRAGALRVWLQERRGDAEMAAAFPPVRRLFGADSRSADGSSPAAGAPSLADELYGQLAHTGGYVAVAAYDQSGRVVASSKGAYSYPGVAAAAVECARRGAAMIRRIPRGATPTDYSLAFLQPIPAGAGGSGPGAVALLVEPETTLFPLLTRKMFEARTEELYLIGAVNGLIECLSPRKLARLPGPPLKADDLSLVGAAALRRPRNLGEFTDYRGERVIAATSLIPETGWGLVAKVDRAEAVPWLRPQSLWILLATAGIFGSVTAAGVAWRRQVSAKHYRTLSERDSRYRSLLERTREGVVGEIDNRLVFANPAALRMFGLSDEREFLGRPFLDFVAPESREKLLEIRRRREAGGAYDRYEILALTATGGRFELELTPVAIDFEGRPAVGATLRDVTEKNRAAAAERRSDERYRLLFERNVAGVFRSTVGGRVLDVNEACARIFGYTIAEFLGLDASVLYPTPGLRAAFLDRLRQTKALRNEELALRRRDGNRVYVLLNANLVEDSRDPQESVLEGTILDVSERRDAEEALRESEEEEKYRTILEEIEEGYFELDLAGNFTFFNESLRRVLGYSREELSGMNNRQYTDAENAKKVFETFHRVYETGSPARGFDWEVIRKDGTRRVVEASVSLIRDPAGQPAGFRGLVHDISERKLAEMTLRRTLLQQEALLNNIPDVAWMKDAEGRFTAINEPFARLVGRPVEQILGKTDFDVFPRELAEKFQAHDQEVFRGGRTLQVDVLKSSDGREIIFETVRTPIPGPSGPVGTAGIARDVTERIRAEEALRRSERRYRSIFDFASVGIYQSRRDGSLVTVNAKLAEILGYPTPEELLAVNLKDVYTDPAARDALIARYDALRVPLRPEVEWRRRDGTLIWVELNAHLIRDELGEDCFEGFVHDVTERKRAEEEREKLERQVAGSQKMEAVGQLAGGIAHDFNNLLTAIAGYSDLLIEGLPPEDQRRAHAEEIRKAGQRAAALTRQLLAFSRRQVLEPKVLDLNSTLEGMEGMLRSVIGEDIRLVTVKTRDFCRVKADPSQVEQAILNLVVNARDAMPRGGELSIETGTAELDATFGGSDFSAAAGGYCVLAVSDTGIGMTSEVKARLFEPFFTTKERGKGTGLGLSTTYGIVKQSGGYIWCDSEPGRGTSFKVYLPRVELPVEKPPAEIVVSLARRGGEKILLVEDEPEVRLLVQKLLKIQGYDVIAAAAPDEALSIVRHLTHAIDLMVTDVVMPGMSGRQLADLLAPTHPNMRVLFISGYTDDSILQHGVLNPGTAFLQKPFTPAALARKVRDVLESPFPAAAAAPPSS